MDLNQLIQSLTQSAAARQQNITDQVAQQNAVTQQMETRQAANTQAADANITQGQQLAGQAANVDHMIRSTLQRAQGILDLDPDVQENALVRTMGTYSYAEDERKKTAQKFSQLSQISLLENPLGWLAAQIQMPGVAARNNELVGVRDAAAQELQTRQTLLAQHKSTVVANTADQLKQVALGKAQLEADAARIKLEEASIANAGAIAARKLQTFQLSDKIFDIQSDLVGKQLQIGQYMMSLAERQEARAERAALARERLDRKNAEASEIMALDVQFQRVSQAMGMTTPMTFEVWKKMPDPKKKQAWLEAATTGTFGKDIVTTMQFLDSNGNPAALAANMPGTNSAMNGFMGAIREYASQISSQARAKGETLKPADALNRGQDEYTNYVIESAKGKTGDSLTAARWDKVFNPYKAPHAAILDEVRGSQNHPLKGNKFVEALGLLAQPGAEITAEIEGRALRSIPQMVADRKLDPNVAAEQIAQYYAYGMAKSRDFYKYDLFGLPAQTTYSGQIGTTGLLGRVSKGNLADPVQVKKMIVEQTLPIINPTAPLTVLNAQRASAERGDVRGERLTAIGDFLRGYKLEDAK